MRTTVVEDADKQLRALEPELLNQLIRISPATRETILSFLSLYQQKLANDIASADSELQIRRAQGGYRVLGDLIERFSRTEIPPQRRPHSGKGLATMSRIP